MFIKCKEILEDDKYMDEAIEIKWIVEASLKTRCSILMHKLLKIQNPNSQDPRTIIRKQNF